LDEVQPHNLDEFTAILERFAGAMNEGRDDESVPAICEAFQYAIEHPLEETPAQKLQMAAYEAEARGDWSTAEKLYLEKLAVETADEVPAGTHWKLARLYQFLGRDNQALAHARTGHELCRDHEIELIRAMAVEVLAGYARADDSAEVEAALQRSLEEMSGERMYALSRAKLLVEIAALRQLRGSASEATQPLDEAFALHAPDSPMHELPGYQRMFARAWQVRAMTQQSLGDSDTAVVSWQNAVDWQARARQSFPDESPLDGDEYSRFLDSAVAGLTAAGANKLADEVRGKSSAVRKQWNLPELNAG
jgi:hypothetical protein